VCSYVCGTNMHTKLCICTYVCECNVYVPICEEVMCMYMFVELIGVYISVLY
jgi:hypothetical protein